MLRRLFAWVVVVVVLWGTAIRAGENDDLDFFAAEAEVVSASRRPQLQHRAPATVYVVTADEIRASGAQTLWDALRTVPGVDVITSRSFQGEVGIRGLNRSLNQRTLVLLDGVTVLNGYADFVTWEGIPVTLEEIDRIEVVEGAASALYGANAVCGVVHIITKDPAQLPRGEAHFSSGQRGTALGSALFSSRGARFDSKLALGWRSTESFENPNRIGSEVGKFNALLRWRPAPGWDLRIGAGGANVNTEFTAAGAGTAFDDGKLAFGRLDLSRRDTHLRAFWNRGRSRFRELNLLQEPVSHYDTYDVSVEQTLQLPGHNSFVAGGSWRRNTLLAPSFDPEDSRQDLAALFFENTWTAAKSLDFVVSGRFDHHPRNKWMFSPRGSLILHPGPRHTLRASTGTSFRNPTLLENHLDAGQSVPNSGADLPNPPYSTLRYRFVGNPDLDPERLFFYELAYHARLGRFGTTLTGYRYELRDLIETSLTQDPTQVPVFEVVQSFTNKGSFEGVGSEASFDYRFGARTRGFLNYTYQDVTHTRAYPRHKVNAGLRWETRAWDAALTGHWVDHSFWPRSLTPGSAQGEVPDYTLLNAHGSYRFQGRLDGWSVGFDVFNLLDHEHHQILPAVSVTEAGQSGELLGSRWLLSIAYRIH
jgi:outer membrane receptor for ferrienterochelin and colicin